MEQNIIAVLFDVESEAYQAFAELKQAPAGEKSILSQVVLARKEGGAIRVIDSFDTGIATFNDTAVAGLAGACLGMLGGPIGMLLGGSYGLLVGSAFDAADAIDQASMLEQVAGKMQDDESLIVALAAEEDEGVLDAKFEKFSATVMRYDAAVVAEEVEEARMMEQEMARQARAESRKEKSDEFKARVEARRAKIKEQFSNL